MKRGDVVTVSVQGDYGRPRPALVAQADVFNETHASITVLPLTSSIVDAPLFRLTIDPSRQNGLTRVSQVMVDKAITVPRAKIGKVIGKFGDDTMIRVSRNTVHLKILMVAAKYTTVVDEPCRGRNG